MLAKPFNIKCIIANKLAGGPFENGVLDLQRNFPITVNSSVIKKTPADNSTSSLLSRALKNELSLCRQNDSNSEKKPGGLNITIPFKLWSRKSCISRV